jgi:hypothetical protein
MPAHSVNPLPTFPSRVPAFSPRLPIDLLLRAFGIDEDLGLVGLKGLDADAQRDKRIIPDKETP